jgi:DNA-binding CsgD family transcriptional regulator
MPERTGSETTAIAPEPQKNSESDSAEWTPWEELYLRSLDVRLYSIKAWEIQTRAKPAHGNPLEPREPGFFGPEVRLAARMCDLANSGMEDASFGPGRHGVPYARMKLAELADAARRFGVEESEAERATRKGITVDRWNEFAETAGAYSVESIFDLVKLTEAERVVMNLIVEGRDQSQIGLATGKALGTVHALRARALKKLKALRPAEAA